MKSVICVVVLAALLNPVLADEYWVEYNYSTQKCSVVAMKSQEPAAATALGITAAHATNLIAPELHARSDAAVSDAANAATSSAVATNTSPADNKSGHTAALLAWAEKKDVAEAARADAEKTSIGTPMLSPEQAVTEMKVIDTMLAIWARKKAISEAARSDAAMALVGTATGSRKQAEEKMQIIRKCGLAP